MNGVFAAYVGEWNRIFEMETIPKNPNMWLMYLYYCFNAVDVISKLFPSYSVNEKENNLLLQLTC